MGKKSDNSRVDSLLITIEEQRKDHDFLDNAYDKASTKNITFLAAALGLLGYLYAPIEAASLRKKMFIPDEPYGVVIYALAFICYSFGIAVLLYALKPRRWSTSYEPDYKDCDDYQNFEKYLEYIKSRYDTICKTNGETYRFKQNLLNISFIPLLLGGIVLLVLKTFGG